MIDMVAITKIIGLDIMLGVDNAVVIALACSAVAPELRNKAILWGTIGAIAMRAILLVFASFLIAVPVIKTAAGLYLLYVAWQLAFASNEDEPNIKSSSSIKGAMVTIMIADFMMSLDNVLAVVGASQSAGEHAMLYSIIGILFSIPIIVLGAKGIVSLMERYKFIIYIGAAVLVWVAIELIITDPAWLMCM